jgi:hypothetical protein
MVRVVDLDKAVAAAFRRLSEGWPVMHRFIANATGSEIAERMFSIFFNLLGERAAVCRS